MAARILSGKAEKHWDGETNPGWFFKKVRQYQMIGNGRGGGTLTLQFVVNSLVAPGAMNFPGGHIMQLSRLSAPSI